MNQHYDDGLFPFGRPNTERPLRPAAEGPAQVLLIGAYPSAFHVYWRAPRHAGGRAIGAMPVEVEPEVFWAGDRDGGAARLARWKTDVGFFDGDEPGAHGTVSAVSGGPMGKVLNVRYLACLAFGRSSARLPTYIPSI